MSYSKQVVLHNPVAGASWASGGLGQLLETLSGDPDVRLIETVRGGIVEQVRSVVAERPVAVFACGGDGTVSDVASGLAGSEIPLGIIPCGTTNVLAREFGIPRDPVRAYSALRAVRSVRNLRTWSMADGRRLVLGAGIGWDARLMHRMDQSVKRRWGFAALVPTAMRLVAGYEFPRLEVVGSGPSGDIERATGTSIIVSNIRYWSGANPAIPMADPGDDLLEVVMFQGSSPTELAGFWTRMMIPGLTPLGMQGVRILRLRELSVSSVSDHEVEVHLNGDPAGHTPLAFVPGDSVRVLVPE